MAPSDFAEVLISGSRSAEIPLDLDIYARLLGNWKMRMIDYDTAGNIVRDHSGIWYFSRTLEGRAIQDVLVSPDFTGRSDNTAKTGNRYGSTIRMMDPKTHQWKIHWFNPVTGIHDELFARPEEDKIIQESAGTDGHVIRWIFDHIQANSFHWHGQDSADNGKTWLLSAEFFATRMNT